MERNSRTSERRKHQDERNQYPDANTQQQSGNIWNRGEARPDKRRSRECINTNDSPQRSGTVPQRVVLHPDIIQHTADCPQHPEEWKQKLSVPPGQRADQSDLQQPHAFNSQDKSVSFLSKTGQASHPQLVEIHGRPLVGPSDHFVRSSAKDQDHRHVNYEYYTVSSRSTSALSHRSKSAQSCHSEASQNGKDTFCTLNLNQSGC